MTGPEVLIECAIRGECGCAYLLDCSARDGVAELARSLSDRGDQVRARWVALLEGAEQEGTVAFPGAHLTRLLDAAALGDAPILANGFIACAQRWRDGGLPLQRAIAASQLLTLALAQSLDRPPEPPVGHALQRFGWLLASLVGVAYGAGLPPGSGPGSERAVEPGVTAAELGHQRAQLSGLVGASQVMRRLYGRIELAARARETVLVTGESGVGKELVAQAIHRVSGDAADRFVAVNCAALPHALIESELFGHKRGSFSGAAEGHRGLVRAAEGGTLFLDEITELEPEAQAKLLRVVQERRVRAVGELTEVPVHVRIVAATNRNLERALAEGSFRRDLYYRLQRLVVEVPPLRARMSDLPLLVAVFVERWAEAYSAPHGKMFTEAAIERLCAHDWPGNVRELENVVFAACLSSQGRLVTVDDLPTFSQEAPLEAGDDLPRPSSMRDAERAAIVGALARAAGNKSLAARILGISRKQLYAKLRLYGIASGLE